MWHAPQSQQCTADTNTISIKLKTQSTKLLLFAVFLLPFLRTWQLYRTETLLPAALATERHELLHQHQCGTQFGVALLSLGKQMGFSGQL
jgi:hypothetical protein